MQTASVDSAYPMAAAAAAAGPTSPAQRSRGFSFRSDKSGASRQKDELVDSPKDKRRKDLIWKQGSKANPNAALSEAQPGANAILEESTLQSLRGFQYRDINGNLITEPDLSNPTRPRFERPLDTIRSFEKAIDNGNQRRSSYTTRSESHDQGNQNGANHMNISHALENVASQNRYMNGSNGGYNGYQRFDGYARGSNGRTRYGAPPRTASEPMMYNNAPRPYPQYSQETFNVGASDSTGPWAHSTNPSSENSSVERAPFGQKPHGDNINPSGGYGQNGYGQNRQPQHTYGSTGYSANGNGHNGYSPTGHGPNGYSPTGHGPNGYSPTGYGADGNSEPMPDEGRPYPLHHGAPAVQPPQPAVGRPIPLGNSENSSGPIAQPSTTPIPAAEKRKSWLKRTFSRKG